jgi:hypothetical protein
VRSMKPEAMAFVPAGKFEGMSVSKKDFQAWKQKPRLPFKPKRDVFEGQVDDRNFQTTSAVSFNDKGYQVRRSQKPEATASEKGAPFTATSLSSEHFKHWKDAKPRKNFKPKSAAHLQERDTRDFQTEKSVAFRPREMQAPARARAPKSIVLKTAKFEGRSVTKSDFPSHAGARPAERFIPTRSKLGSEALPFEGHTNYSENFKGTTAPPVRSVKPEAMAFVPAGKFEGTSDYQCVASPRFSSLFSLCMFPGLSVLFSFVRA